MGIIVGVVRFMRCLSHYVGGGSVGVMQCLSLCGDYSGRSEVYAVYIGGYGNILGGGTLGYMVIHWGGGTLGDMVLTYLPKISLHFSLQNTLNTHDLHGRLCMHLFWQ